MADESHSPKIRKHSESDAADSDSDWKSGASSDKSSMELPEPRQFIPQSESPEPGMVKGHRDFAKSYDYDAQSIDFRRLFSTGTEVANPVRARVNGKIPEWLSGTLLRNGPGMYQMGLDNYKHWFDPLAMIQRFHIDPKGRVFYTAQFLQSEAFQRNRAAGKIIVNEFGTVGAPDPKKNIFTRYFSHLFPKEPSDNNLYNFLLLGDDVYTTSESGVMNKINWDTRTLGACKQESLKKHLAIHSVTSHPHYDNAGNVYNVGTGNNSYVFIKIPAPQRQRRTTDNSDPGDTPNIRQSVSSVKDEEKNPFAAAEIIGGISFQNGSQPAYVHSFGMSENHFGLFEIPLFLNGLKYKFRNFADKSFSDCLDWHPKKKTLVHLIHVCGRRINLRYKADPMFLFHHINSYEEGGCVIMDVVAYRDAAILKRLEIDNLRNGVFPTSLERPQVWRFVLPLDVHQDAKYGEDLLKWTHLRCRARAILQKDDTIFCHPEQLTDKALEYPRINYGMKNGLKYRYCYGTEIPSDGSALFGSKLFKVDVEKHKTVEWRRETHHQFVGEPVFVPRPGATEEDDGVILVTLSSTRPGEKSGLLVLDASSFVEVARAEVNVMVAPSFHGEFLGKVRMFFDTEMSETQILPCFHIQKMNKPLFIDAGQYKIHRWCYLEPEFEQWKMKIWLVFGLWEIDTVVVEASRIL